MSQLDHCMKNALKALLCFGISIAVQADDHVAWYTQDYAPLWTDEPAESMDEILSFYATTVTSYGEDEGPLRMASREWLAEPMAEWVAEGWLNAELTGLISEQLNDNTAVFQARWLDHYRDGSTEISCGWYLAARSPAGWNFSAYADIDCSDYDFE